LPLGVTRIDTIERALFLGNKLADEPAGIQGVAHDDIEIIDPVSCAGRAAQRADFRHHRAVLQSIEQEGAALLARSPLMLYSWRCPIVRRRPLSPVAPAGQIHDGKRGLSTRRSNDVPCCQPSNTVTRIVTVPDSPVAARDREGPVRSRAAELNVGAVDQRRVKRRADNVSVASLSGSPTVNKSARGFHFFGRLVGNC
jgi:hypothetical protein